MQSRKQGVHISRTAAARPGFCPESRFAGFGSVPRNRVWGSRGRGLCGVTAVYPAGRYDPSTRPMEGFRVCIYNLMKAPSFSDILLH
jgi:hypothetical protein